MKLISTFPEVLYVEILSYLEDTDRLAFAGVDKDICSRLMKKVRIIHVTQIREFFEQLKKRNYILRLMENPYYQLIGEDLDPLSTSQKMNASSLPLSFSVAVLKLSFSFSFAVLKMNVRDFEACISTYSVSQVKSLTLSLPSDYSSVSSVLSSKRMPRIKQLRLIDSDGEVSEIPVIPGLESLWCTKMSGLYSTGLQSYVLQQKLRCLTLTFCHGITDVSCLDGIWDLKLEYCDGIRDVSCLNHNHKIKINCCDKIREYTSCFQHSSIIELRILQQGPYGVNLEHFSEAKKIILHGEFIIPVNEKRALQLPSSGHLTSFSIISNSLLFYFPENHTLNDVTIDSCPHFLHFKNMGNIKRLTLEGLRNPSLLGLGVGNRFVTLQDCRQITDFSVLNTCQKVVLDGCRGCVDLTQLKDVKEVHLRLRYFDTLKSLNGVTELNLATSYKISPEITSLILQASTIRVIILQYDLMDLKSFICELSESSSIEKIMIDHIKRDNTAKMPRVYREKLNCHRPIFEKFMLINPVNSSYEILLRRKEAIKQSSGFPYIFNLW